jgi:hypothetical protein
MNRPWFWRSRQGWYVSVGRTQRFVGLTEDEALREWRRLNPQAEQVDSPRSIEPVENPQFVQNDDEPRGGIGDRYRQFRRVFVMAEILRSLRFGLTVESMAAELAERSGEAWSDRTLQRDLRLLEELGLIDRVRADDGTRYRWRDRTIDFASTPAARVPMTA